MSAPSPDGAGSVFGLIEAREETPILPSRVASTGNANNQQSIQKRANRGADPGPKETTFHPVKTWKMRQGNLASIQISASNRMPKVAYVHPVI